MPLLYLVFGPSVGWVLPAFLFTELVSSRQIAPGDVLHLL